VEYRDQVAGLGREHAGLAAEIAGFHTLENVLAWMQRRGLPLSSIEIIFQDEFSHDFLVPLEPAGTHLVFGIT
jgi:hypothetical protein